MQNSAILPLFYLPPVSYFRILTERNTSFFIEKQEHFPKQTYRNRAEIASPNGKLVLTLPVVKGSKNHTSVKDVKLSYDIRWQRLHWLSLQTCYRSAAYFEYYEDGLAPFYEKKYTFLFDFNLELFDWLRNQLKLNTEYTLTKEYESSGYTWDYRAHFTKNKLDRSEQFKSYFQVFSDRNAFIPNLSIVDLLFNQGPQSKSYF